jgi:hypothetical protein
MRTIQGLKKCHLFFFSLLFCLFSTSVASADYEEDKLIKISEAEYYIQFYGLSSRLGSIPVSEEDEAHRFGRLNQDGSVVIRTVVVKGDGKILFYRCGGNTDGAAVREVWDLTDKVEKGSIRKIPSLDVLRQSVSRHNTDRGWIGRVYCLYQKKNAGSMDWGVVKCPFAVSGDVNLESLHDFFDRMERFTNRVGPREEGQ